MLVHVAMTAGSGERTSTSTETMAIPRQLLPVRDLFYRSEPAIRPNMIGPVIRKYRSIELALA
jgi:hypothetical protein